MRICRASLFCLTVLLLVAGADAQHPIRFSTWTPVPSGPASASVSGDVDGDGSTDLVQLSTGQTTVTAQVYFGNSSGTYTAAAPQTLNCVSTGYSYTLHDLNKDGKDDLLLNCSNLLTVFLSNGDGTFSAPIYASNALTSAVVGDFNGDGYPDVIVPASYTTWVTLLNKGGLGAGGFATAIASGISATPEAAADFTHDGKADLLLNNGTSFLVAPSNGDGTFGTPITVGPSSRSFLVADFNNDGYPDILVATPTDTTITVQLYLGSGSSFTLSKTLTLPTNDADETCTLLFAGTTHGGQDIDVAVQGQAGDTTILLGDGAGGLTVGQSYMLPPLLSLPLARSANLLSLNGGTFSFAGNGDGTFVAPRLTLLDTEYEIQPGDINGDGFTDLLGVDTKGNLQAALSQPDGTFTVVDPTSANGSIEADAIDLNGDGKVDVVGENASHGTGHGYGSTVPSLMNVFIGNGDGSFRQTTTNLALGVIGAGGAKGGDFNGDGKVDLIMPFEDVYDYVDGVMFLAGNGDGTFAAPVTVSTDSDFFQTPAVGLSKLLLGDLNRDGNLDFVWGDKVYLGNGHGAFALQPLVITGSGVALADLNGDGILDLVTMNGLSIQIYAGTGSGNFAASPFYTFTVPTATYGFNPISDVNIGDVTGDGFPDIVIQTDENGEDSADHTIILVGAGNGTFTLDPHVYGIGKISSYSPTFLARMNRNAPVADTLLDYVVGTVVLFNNASPTVIPTSTALSASASTVGTGAPVTLTALVTGATSGTVNFTTSSGTLGSGAVDATGKATLATSFSSNGMYAITASFVADSTHAASSSSAVTVTVATPSFTFIAGSSTAQVSPGGSAQIAFTVTSALGYSGVTTFACGTLPAEASCSFSPSTVTPNGTTPATTTLTISTTASHTEARTGRVAAAFAGLGMVFLLAFNPRKRRSISAICLILLGVLAMGVSGCSSGGSNPTVTVDPGTPAGTYSIVVTATGPSPSPAQSFTVQLTVQ